MYNGVSCDWRVWRCGLVVWVISVEMWVIPDIFASPTPDDWYRHHSSSTCSDQNKQAHLRQFSIKKVLCYMPPHVICWADLILRRQNDCHKLIILIMTPMRRGLKTCCRPPCHRRSPPHRSRPCPAWSGGSWSAPWSTSAARRALSPGGDRVSINSSSRKSMLRKMWHIAKKDQTPYHLW